MKTVVFSYARMNPPTTGHDLLVSTVVETARQYNSDHVVFLSQTQNFSTDPLAWRFKRRVCEAAFPGVNISNNEIIRTPFQALEGLVRAGYNRAVLVVGGDRIEEFKTRMTPYAARWGIDFTVISAGNRITESTDVEGMSATKMREFARNNCREEFYKGLPDRLSNAIKALVYENTRKGLKKA